MTLSSLSPSIRISLGIHFFMASLFFLATQPWSFRREVVDFEIFSQPKIATQSAIRIEKPTEKPAPEKRAVFGASRKSILATSTESGNAEVKSGNTVAKEMDRKELDANDPESLPIPTEEYLVTSMPVLEQDYRIPYPPEAKKAKIQGRVVMKLLIDGDGKVRRATLLEGPGFGLNEAAMEAIKNFKFRPAQVRDRRVAVEIQFAYRFVLERK